MHHGENGASTAEANADSRFKLKVKQYEPMCACVCVSVCGHDGVRTSCNSEAVQTLQLPLWGTKLWSAALPPLASLRQIAITGFLRGRAWVCVHVCVCASALLAVLCTHSPHVHNQASSGPCSLCPPPERTFIILTQLTNDTLKSLTPSHRIACDMSSI